MRETGTWCGGLVWSGGRGRGGGANRARPRVLATYAVPRCIIGLASLGLTGSRVHRFIASSPHRFIAPAAWPHPGAGSLGSRMDGAGILQIDLIALFVSSVSIALVTTLLTAGRRARWNPSAKYGGFSGALMCARVGPRAIMSEPHDQSVRPALPVRRRLKSRRVVVISCDTSLVAMVADALLPRDQVITVAAPSDLPSELPAQVAVESATNTNSPGTGTVAADTVVVDLPEQARRQACAQVRERYHGRLLVVVDQATETVGWPDDAARHFLIRPVSGEELAAALRRPDRQPASWSRLATTATTVAPVSRPVTEPEPALGPGSAAPVRRLSSDDPLWEESSTTINGRVNGPTSSARPKPLAPALRGLWRFQGSRRMVVELVAAVVVLLVVGLGGFAIGRSTASTSAGAEEFVAPDRTESSGFVVPSPATRPLTSSAGGAATAQPQTPPACDAALQDADATISYMVGHITDQRLTQAIERLQTDRRACRHVNSSR